MLLLNPSWPHSQKVNQRQQIILILSCLRHKLNSLPNGEFVADYKVKPNSIKVTYFVLCCPERQVCFHTPGPVALREEQ